MFQQSQSTSNPPKAAGINPLQKLNLLANEGSHNMSSFYSLNFLEESMSYLERTARKLMPILNEIKKRMVPEKTIKEKMRKIGASSTSNLNPKGKIETLDSVHEDIFNLDEERQSQEGQKT
jgi:hypothetical protein